MAPGHAQELHHLNLLSSSSILPTFTDLNNIKRFSSREKALQWGRGGVSGGPKAVRRSPKTKTERVEQRTAGEITQHVISGGCWGFITPCQSFLSSLADSGAPQQFQDQTDFSHRWRTGGRSGGWRRGRRQRMVSKADKALRHKPENCTFSANNITLSGYVPSEKARHRTSRMHYDVNIPLSCLSKHR